MNKGNFQSRVVLEPLDGFPQDQYHYKDIEVFYNSFFLTYFLS